MAIKTAFAALVSLSICHAAAAQHAPAPPPSLDPQLVAQANDRCMATYAVRLSKTGARDPELYAQARQACAPVRQQLAAALRAKLVPAQATETLRTLEAQAEPNFLSMLTRIRRDRAASAAEPDATAQRPAASVFDPANSTHCEVAFGILVIVADNMRTADAPDLRRRLALAKRTAGARFTAEEGSAARNAIWPVVKDAMVSDRAAFHRSAQACAR